MLSNYIFAMFVIIIYIIYLLSMFHTPYFLNVSLSNLTQNNKVMMLHGAFQLEETKAAEKSQSEIEKCNKWTSTV